MTTRALLFFFTFMVNFDCNLFQVMIEPRRINVRGIISVQPDTGSGGGAIVFLVFFPLFFFFSTIRWKKIAYSHQRTVYCNQLRIQFALIIRIPITGPFDSPTSVRFFFFFNPTVPLSLVSPITICLAVYFFFSISLRPSNVTFHARIFIRISASITDNSPRSSLRR